MHLAVADVEEEDVLDPLLPDLGAAHVAGQLFARELLVTPDRLVIMLPQQGADAVGAERLLEEPVRIALFSLLPLFRVVWTLDFAAKDFNGWLIVEVAAMVEVVRRRVFWHSGHSNLLPDRWPATSC
jgi:hypothetical protein